MRTRSNAVIGVWVGFLVANLLVTVVAAQVVVAQEDGRHLPLRPVVRQPIQAGAGLLRQQEPGEQGLGSQGNRELDPAILEEIKQIRKQLGGGVAAILGDIDLTPVPQSRNAGEGEEPVPPSLLNGGVVGAVANPDSPSLPSELRADFDQEIYRLMRDQGQSPQARPVPMGVPVSGLSTVTSSSRGAAVGRTFVPNSRQAQVLRASARQLEEVAAGLEEEGLYSQADQVRDQARAFWVQARPSSEKKNIVQ